MIKYLLRAYYMASMGQNVLHELPHLSFKTTIGGAIIIHIL